MRCYFNLFLVLMIMFAGLLTSPVMAQKEGEASYTATTTADPAIEKKNLELVLKPLFKEELEVEAKAWLDLLKEKVGEHNSLDIDLQNATGDQRAQLIEKLADLGQSISSLASRANIAIKAWEAKGGEVEDYKKYLSQATGTSPGFDPLKIWIKLKGWVISTEGGVATGLNMLKFLLTLIVFWILAAVLGSITKKAVSSVKKTSELLKDFFVNSVRKVTLFIGLVIAVSFLGVDIGPFLAAIGVVGFVIGFALQDTLSNFASGIMILLYRPYDVGDFINVAGTLGKVNAMSLVSTTILTPDNQNVIVPNGQIWGGVITNITGNDTRRVDLVFGIGYSDDIAKAQGILEDILRSNKMVLKNPAPVIKVHELGDSSVNFVVRPWSKTSDYWDVYWDITRAVKERFDAEGVSIPFPQRDVHLFNETQA